MKMYGIVGYFCGAIHSYIIGFMKKLTSFRIAVQKW